MNWYSYDPDPPLPMAVNVTVGPVTRGLAMFDTSVTPVTGAVVTREYKAVFDASVAATEPTLRTSTRT